MAVLILLLGLWLPLAAHAEPPCRVLDPNLAEHYAGPCLDGLAEGRGSARGLAQYEGEFQAGRKHGEGRYEWPGGARYEGRFAQDLRHGPGRFWNESGQKLDTTWAFDQAIGPLSPMWRTYFIQQAAAAAALATPGATVCAGVKLGLTGTAWIRATVIDAASVRVDHTGPHPLSWQGQALAPGTVLRALPGRWQPCS